MKYTLEAARTIARRLLQPGDSVLEIGAADGTYTHIYADRVGPEGHVLAIEPHAEQAHHLALMTRDSPQVITKDCAVGPLASTGVLYVNSHATHSSLYAANVGAIETSYAVSITTIDDLVREMPHAPALIHVDAQGAEAAILEGATRTLGLAAVWVIELWRAGLEVAGASIADVLAPFEARRYLPHDVRGHLLTWRTVHDDAEARPAHSYSDLLLMPQDGIG